jgi:hypothetical protein
MNIYTTKQDIKQTGIKIFNTLGGEKEDPLYIHKLFIFSGSRLRGNDIKFAAKDRA